jgi:hypothetical protein
MINYTLNDMLNRFQPEKPQNHESPTSVGKIYEHLFPKNTYELLPKIKIRNLEIFLKLYLNKRGLREAIIISAFYQDVSYAYRENFIIF